MSELPMSAQTEQHLFPELYGFFIADPILIDAFHDHDANGRNLLALYSSTEVGDVVAASGVAIPILNLEPGYYAVTLRDHSQASPLVEPALDMASGWVLHVASGNVVIGGVGCLTSWDPDNPRLRRIPLSPDWYSVDIRVGLSKTDDDFAIDLVLQRRAAQPPFLADLGWIPKME